MPGRRKIRDPRGALARVELISGLSDQGVEDLLGRSERRDYPDGSVLFLEGEPCEGMHLIVEGAARIYKTSSAGREIQLALQQAPTSVAEVPVFDGGPYPASARAVGDVLSYHVSKGAFAELIRRYPDLSLNILAVVGSRLRALVDIVHLLTFGGLRTRLARSLLEMEERNGCSPFVLSQTHGALAASLGTVREVVTRNLARFQSEGMIRIENHRVWIEDRAGLRAEAESDGR